MKKRKVKKNSDFFESLNYAIEGIGTAIKREKNIRREVVGAVIAIIMSIVLRISIEEVKDIALAITLVFVIEFLNSAIEAVVDLVTLEYRPLAKKAKDIAAGAVLITSLYALFIGYLVFVPKLKVQLIHYKPLVRYSYIDTFMVALVIVIALVLIIKRIYGKGSPLQGGMPSGHSAIAFAAWVGISFTTTNIIVQGLTLGLALLIAESRIEGKIHSLKEVVAGGLLGAIVTYVILRIVF